MPEYIVAWAYPGPDGQLHYDRVASYPTIEPAAAMAARLNHWADVNRLSLGGRYFALTPGHWAVQQAYRRAHV